MSLSYVLNSCKNAFLQHLFLCYSKVDQLFMVNVLQSTVYGEFGKGLNPNSVNLWSWSLYPSLFTVHSKKHI